MIKNDEPALRTVGRSMNRVSSAVWPAKVRKGVATGKAAQRRRDWIMHGRWVVILADVLSLRPLLVLTCLLVVASSLVVAALGLRFWYILLMPLLLFGAILALPPFLASKKTLEATQPSLTAFSQEFKSSTGLLSLYPESLRSNPGFLQELKSGPGFFQDVRSSQGLPGVESPATPMPFVVYPPLVRVLETYDLRGEKSRPLPEDTRNEETGEHTLMLSNEREPWISPPATESLHTERIRSDVPHEHIPGTRKIFLDEFPRSEPGARANV